MKITHRVTGATLYEGEHETMKECLAAALQAGADLAGAYLAGAHLARANLARANLADACLADAYLADADLAGANLADANLAYADLAGANLAGADLARANLAYADLAYADLAGADLAGANLARANLAYADLAYADLAGANLARANLARANLAYADLAYADLAGANLARANLGETGGSEPVQGAPQDRAERLRQRAARYRARNPDVPVVEALDATLLGIIESGKGTLRMDTWHTCETTHCRAGWAVTLAGAPGKALESLYGPERAGGMIYRASTGRLPHFFATDERALADIREHAALQAPLATEAPGA